MASLCRFSLAAVALSASGCGAIVDYTIADGNNPGVEVSAPRLIAPMSTSMVTTLRPTLRWAPGTGLEGQHIEICADRSCATVQQGFDVTGSSAVPTVDLSPGVHYWRVMGTVPGQQSPSTSFVWEFFVGLRATPVDTVARSIPDFNGDGYADVVVGATEATIGGNASQGAAYVYYGSPQGLTTVPQVTLDGPDGAGGYAGRSVASAGDVDGDGYADLVVGAYGVNTFTGSAYVYYGGPAGIDPAHRATLSGADGPNGNFGFNVSGVGDTDGDGYGDLAVSAYGVNASTGRMYLFNGGAQGVDASRFTAIDGPDGAGSLFGSTLGDVGDLDGDGYNDVVVGALGVNSSAGRAYVYPGGPSGISSSHVQFLNTPDGANGWFGRWITGLGDTNGDGYPDLGVAEDHVNGGLGKVWVYTGGAGGVTDTRRTLLGGLAGAGAFFGDGMSGAGDVNGDGYADVLVGAQWANGGMTGAAYVYFGGPGDPGQPSMDPTVNRVPDVTFGCPDGAGSEFGRAVSTAGDVNGDGFGDLVVSADQVGSNTGRVYVYLGSATLPGLAPTQMNNGRDPQTVLTGPDGAGGHFGWDVAMRSRRTTVETSPWGLRFARRTDLAAVMEL